jgi:ketosteroid isomerase-like protein
MTAQEKILHAFNALNKDNLQVVDEFYHPDVTFIDPVDTHQGIEATRSYYRGLYQNVKSIKFDFSQMIEQGDTVVGVWKMTLVTDGLNGGKPMELQGNSVITFHPDGRVIYHRDYFDMGEFIYERLPVIGFLVRKVKERLKQSP